MSQKICPQCGTEYDIEQKFCPKDGTTLRLQGGQTGDLIGAVIADRYNILKKLGEGGMGTVYLAEHVKMGRKSAIKVMNPGMVSDADAISRFNREASNASRINHPNVASVYDFGETSDGIIYLAMEFIEGPSLTKVIEDNGSLPPMRAAEITRQAAEALSVAHDMGIVHRDLKPDNIMLATGRGGTDIVKVVDFGIAKAAEGEGQNVTKTGLVVGTPEYMSPEQLAGDKLDGRSDSYSLALVTYAMLTGKLPFPAETIQESMIKRLTDEPKPLAEMKSDTIWPDAVQAVITKALDRDAVNRYQTASDYGRALHAAVEAMPRGRASMATAVIGRVSTPKAASPAPSADPTKAIPATRVNQVTPHTPAKAMAAPAAQKSKTPMIAVAAIVVLAAAGGGYVMMNKDKGAETLSRSLNQATPAGEPATTAPAPTLAGIFASIDSAADILTGTTATAAAALIRLDSIAPQAQSDSDKVHVQFARAKAHFTLSDGASDPATRTREKNAGCAILRDNEGAASRTRFKENFEFLLYGDTKKGFAGQC